MDAGRADHADAAFLGELPWAAPAREYPDTWHVIERGSGLGSRPPDVYPAWRDYRWSGSTLDCSIDHTVEAQFPAPILFEAGGLNWIPGTRQWAGPDGEIAAQYQEVNGHAALLVRETWLKWVVRQTGHPMVFGWFGEKRLMETGSDYPIVGDWTQIDAVASLERQGWSIGDRSLTRRKGSA